MPKANFKNNPAVQTALDIYAQAQKKLKKMQQPSEGTSPLTAAIMGGIGGAGEAALNLFGSDDEEDLVMNAVMGSANPLGMVRIPSHLVGELAPRFAKNFINRVPQRLADEGQLPLAEQLEKLATAHPQWFGQLEHVGIDPTLKAVGKYSSTLDINDDLRKIDDAIWYKAADAGVLPPTSNKMIFNPRLIKENNPGRIMVPVDPTNPSTTMNMLESAEGVARHETKHLDQDIQRLITKGTNLPYYVRPNEVEARIFEKNMPFDPETIKAQLLYGKNRELTNLRSSVPKDAQKMAKLNLGESILKSAQELLRRQRGLPENTIPAVPSTLLDYLWRGLGMR